MTLVNVGCGDDDNDAEQPADEAEQPADELVPEGRPYLLSSDEGWDLKEAVDVAPGSTAAEIDPSMQWFAEYERFPDPNSSQRVVVSQHDETVAQLQDRHRADVAWRDVDVADAGVVVGTTDGGPSVVLAETEGGGTLSVLSGELSPEELTDWAATLEPVTVEEWEARGGIVQP